MEEIDIIYDNVEVIDVFEGEEYDIEIDEAFPPLSSDAECNHALLNNREIGDQHPITAITGLRDELDNIEALGAIFSSEKNCADYYEWADGNIDQEPRVGYFVSVCEDVRKINICNGKNIFGVTVDTAAFIGGQDAVPMTVCKKCGHIQEYRKTHCAACGSQDIDYIRDSQYGLVATSGAVHVRCELDVAVGDCVTSNAYGMAEKTESGCGYKVVALHNIDGVLHATIQLNISADQIDLMGATLIELDSRMDDAEANIVSAINVANQAYQKASGAITSNQEMSNKVDGALTIVDDMSSSVADMEVQVSNSALLSAQAKAIAESAATAAESIKNEAVEKVNESLVKTTKLRDDFALMEQQITNVEDNVTIVTNRINGEYKIIESWDEDSDYDDDTVYYAEDTKLYHYYDNGVWKESQYAADAGLPVAIAGMQAKVDDHSASVNNLVSWQGYAKTSMARIEQKADANGAYIQSTVANIDRYTVGPHSQAFGFTLEQAANVLEEGTFYVPTVNVEEEYRLANEAADWIDGDKDITKVYSKVDKAEDGTSTTQYWYYGWDDTKSEYTWLTANEIPTTEPRSFTPGYLYKWGRIKGIGPYGWTTVDKDYNELEEVNDSTMVVNFFPREIKIHKDNNNDNYGYWYTQPGEDGKIYDSDGIETTKYELYTLYKWDLPYKYIDKDDNGEEKEIEEYHWVAVATLAGNVSNRAMSQIRQDTNNIMMAVTNPSGSVAGLALKLDEVSASVNSLASWKNGGEVNEAIIRQHTDGGKSSIIISTYEKNGENITKAASLELKASKEDSSSLILAADNIKFTATADYTVLANNIDLKGKITLSSLDENLGETVNNSIQSVKVKYALSSKSDKFDPVEGTSGKWSEKAPSWQEGTYMWQQTTTTTSVDSYTSETCIQGAKGKEGVGVSKVAPRYYISDGNTENDKPNNNANDDNGWFEDFDEMLSKYWNLRESNAETTYYIWTQECVEYSDGRFDYSTPTVDGASSVIAFYCKENGVTKIDGGNIATNTITANALSTDAISSIGKELTIQADQIILDGKVAFTTPDSDGGATRINGDGIATGTVTAEKISVDKLDAITADLGVVKAGALQSPKYNQMMVWGEEDVINFSTGLNYKLSGDNYYIVQDIGDCTDKDVIIPSVYNNLPVREIRASAFNSTDIISVTIPDSVTSIGNSAFSGCSSLTSIVIPDSVTSIGNAAFEDCSGLESITLPFVGATKDGTTNTHFGYIFGASSYSNNNNFVPKSLKTVVITGGTSIGSSAFYYCSSLTSVEIGDGVTSIGEYAFRNCSSLTSVTIGDSVTSIENGAFLSCSSLTSITIPDSMTTIGSNAFSSCSKLIDVIIGKNVSLIKEHAFNYCSALQKVYYDGTASAWGKINISTLNNNALTDAERYYYSETEPTDTGNYWRYHPGFRLSCDDDNMIDSRYFKVGNDGIITSTGGNIGGWTIDENALYSTNGLMSTGICAESDNITYSEGLEFAAWSNPGECQVKGLGDCTDGAIIIPKVSPDGDRVVAIASRAFVSESSIRSVYIPDSVLSIGNGAFYGCSNLASVWLPNNLKTIENGTFYECSSLASIIIPNNVTAIDDSAFSHCESLTNIDIPANVAKIGMSAFNTCSSLTRVTIPDSVTSIGTDAFKDCHQLVIYTSQQSQPQKWDENWNRSECHVVWGANVQSGFASLVDGNVASSPRYFAGTYNATTPNLNANANFLVLSDGSLYSRAADIRGNINAISGRIGNIDISGSGLRSVHGWTLDQNGLALTSKNTRLRIDQSSWSYDPENHAIQFEMKNHCTFKGNSGSLVFNKPSSNQTVSVDVYLRWRAYWRDEIAVGSRGKTNCYITLQLVTANQAVFPEDRTYETHWRVRNRDKDVDAGNISFTLPAGQTESNLVNVHHAPSRNQRHIFQCGIGPYHLLTSLDFQDTWNTNDSPTNWAPRILYLNDSYTPSAGGISVVGNLLPDVPEQYNLGNGAYRWHTVFAITPEIDASDRNMKRDIAPLGDGYEQIFDSLSPVSYKFIDNESNRTHTGLIAQDVKAAVENAGLTTQDFAGYCEWTNDDGTTGCGLRYGEFISLCIDQIQKLKKRVEELEEKLSTK